MRRRAFLLIAALVLALSAAPAALAQDGDKDCADFASQAEAQAYFEANGGSPTNNVDNLDADHDGQACESFDYGDGEGGGGSGGGGTGGSDKDCADFATQAEAQAYFEANGGSPTNNVDNLDADHDGQACEDFDYGDSTGGGTGGGGTGGGDNGGVDNGGVDNGGGALPFTGPNDTLLPAGTALLLAGLALVGVTRYRARHARR
jgi:hypothetical protein